MAAYRVSSISVVSEAGSDGALLCAKETGLVSLGFTSGKSSSIKGAPEALSCPAALLHGGQHQSMVQLFVEGEVVVGGHVDQFETASIALQYSDVKISQHLL